MTQAFLLTWNPKKWPWPKEQYAEEVEATSRGETYPLEWSCGNTKRIAPGDRLYMVRLNDQRGIIGSGIAKSEPKPGKHWDKSRKGKALYAHGESDVLLPEGLQLPVCELKNADLGIAWDNLLKSGNMVPPESASKLERMWQKHVKRVRRGLKIEFGYPTEVRGRFIEGAVKRIQVNAYERDPKARRACIAHHGYTCAVCDQSLADIYGSVGERVIHVHHVKDLSTLGADYDIDPRKDLRPVCPNCHAILHTVKPAMSIRRLRSILAKQRKV